MARGHRRNPPRGKTAGVAKAIDTLQRACVNFSDLSSEDAEAMMKLAQDIIRADYYADVRGIGDEVLGEIKNGDITTKEQLDESVRHSVDGSHTVIYTYAAKLALTATDNADAYQEETGEKPESPEVAIAFAMMTDVNEYVWAHDEVKGLEDY